MLYDLQKFNDYLIRLEKSDATRQKYLRDARQFVLWLCTGKYTLDKETALSYKNALAAVYTPSSVNAKLSAVNTYLTFLERPDCKIKTLKMQKQTFAPTERELTRAEYTRLLAAAKKRKNKQLFLLLQTLCGLGLRVSELKCVTVEAAKNKTALIACKGKTRAIPLPGALCDALLRYADGRKIESGPVFITKGGLPVDRSNIWKMMKLLCKKTDVPYAKVFPHNLRHLFARTFYAREKDVVRLADILGHSSIDTTRIYTMESGELRRRAIERLGLADPDIRP